MATENSLAEYCKSMKMSYSYKPTLILALIHNKGKISLSEAANFFLQFYASRLRLGLIAEKYNSIYSNLNCSFEQVKQNIRNNPIKALTGSSNFFYYNSKREVLEIVPSCWDFLTKSDINEIVNICNKRLERYFNSIQNTMQSNIICFQKPEDINGFLSNQFYAPFSVFGKDFTSISQYMAYRKALFFGYENKGQKILTMTHPDEIDSIQIDKNGLLLEFWNGQRQIIAYQGLLSKFAQNVSLAEELINTGSCLIAACLPEDTVWGNGLEIDDDRVRKLDMWRGKNLLGYTLMQVRSAIYTTYKI